MKSDIDRDRGDRTSMPHARLTINLAAVTRNWRRLDALTPHGNETAAVVKADAYGLGLVEVSTALQHAGVETFFVAMPEEASQLRSALGPGPDIFLLSGYMSGDSDLIAEFGINPVLASIDQFERFSREFPGHPYGIQLDTGMNRLGIEQDEFARIRDQILRHKPDILISHLANGDMPDSALNARQRESFMNSTRGLNVRCSLAATGGILLGGEYHFDLCRPGIGLYGGDPFTAAENVLNLDVPIVQVHEVHAGETVGYGAEWKASESTRVATVLSGYSDGLFRRLGGGFALRCGTTKCPVIGRISMDLITVDISRLNTVPESLQVISDHQTVNDVAKAASTIANEVLTSIGQRYKRVYRS